MNDLFWRFMFYMLARLKEPSSYIGLVKILAAGSWHEMDHSSQGEVIMQYAIIAVGALEVVLPQKILYKVRNGTPSTQMDQR